ncbi:uncharacterized protein LOC135839370 [Planococcus citri]|uniref:uncharacterized protein LOC135839370 n=1 Tax=Planococcus citri TaxID=170843 RepID=UPI0031F7E90D
MAETTSPSRVYDLLYPSPVTLKEIAAISLVAELWREENAAKEITTRDELKLAEDIVLKKIPDVPSAIYNLLAAYSAKLSSSVSELKSINFHYVVPDWDGTIDHVRTAKRKILCDRLTALQKFRIACEYCLEDDIRRLWPSVSSNFDLNRYKSFLFFRDFPIEYYWILCLKNELHNIPNPHDEPIDEMMIYECRNLHQSYASLEYFWNRIPYNDGGRLQATIMMSKYDPSSFSRFVLPRLDDVQREEFLAKQGVEFMFSSLICNEHVDRIHVLSVWMYIRNKMNISEFIILIEKLLDEETYIFTIHSKDKVYACCEVWENSPDNLKQSALNAVLSNNTLFEIISNSIIELEPHHPRRQMIFLITILSDANFELRHKFWYENWRYLITGARVEDLQAVMKLCFRNENDISSFKERYMSKYDNIGPYCVEALRLGWFKEVNEFLSFCYSDQQKARDLKQQLLRSNFLGENSILHIAVFLYHKKGLNAFVEDTFEDVDDRVEFKNQFVSSPVTERHLFDCIRNGCFICLTQFVETFVPEERAGVLKQRLLDNFKEQLVSGVIRKMKSDRLQRFLVWLLDSEDEIGEFKQSLSVGDIFRNIVEVELNLTGQYGDDPKYPDRLDDFLSWFFDNDAEEIRNIKEQYSDLLWVFSLFLTSD